MAGLQHKLTEEILDRVLYGMENQRENLRLDLADGTLKTKKTGDENLVPLPPWGPNEGYRLREQFAATLPNQAVSRKLQNILSSGSGVFRRFKNALAERPELEKLWRNYKMREMRKIAVSWLNRWYDAQSLEDLDEEPEEWDDITLSDFTVRQARQTDEGELRKLFQHEADGEDLPSLNIENILVAEAPERKLTGFSRLGNGSEEKDATLSVYVQPEYRNLGIEQMLAEQSLGTAKARGIETISIIIPNSQTALNSWLEHNGFYPVCTTWIREK
ncbi:MAG: hypothetical protein B0D92_03860 [Spirochaeta sp. LUC14_002_19_P3]|nr:MAG: hypothetical protein B0D92_03860 [Spirochaeta sp. LUC14_002_19_P3]